MGKETYILYLHDAVVRDEDETFLESDLDLGGVRRDGIPESVFIRWWGLEIDGEMLLAQENLLYLKDDVRIAMALCWESRECGL